MLLCASTLFAFDQPLKRLLEVMKNTGMKRWEVIDEPPNKLEDRVIRALRKTAQDHGIEINVHAPFMAVGYSSLSDETRQRSLQVLDETISAAAYLESKYVVIHPPRRYDVDLEKEKELMIQGIGRLSQAAEENAMLLLVENAIWGTPLFLSSLDECQAFLRAVSDGSIDQTGLCLDTGHANIHEGVGPYLTKLFDHIHNIHVHDNKGKMDSHDAVGDGTIDWHLFTRILRRKGYERFITIETAVNPAESLRTISELVESD